MSTVNDVLTFARAQTQTDANGLTDAKGIIFANEALFDFRRRLVDKGVDALGVQEAYRDGAVAASGNGSTFLYPTDAMFLKAIEVNFQDYSSQNYITAEQVDISNLSGQNSFGWLRQNCSTRTPKFDDHGDWFEIFPSFTSTMNLTQAIRIFYFQKPTEYTSVADTISYPESLDYRILGWRVASNYYYSLSKDNEGDKLNLRYDERVKQFTGTLGRGSQQPLQATVIPLTGWEF